MPVAPKSYATPFKVTERPKKNVASYFSKKKANPKNMAKTTKKGAYAKGKKKQMAIRRAPLVETFKYQSAPVSNSNMVLSRTSAYNNVLNQAFCCAYTQGLDVPSDGLSTTVNLGPTCRGRDIYSKLTKTKLRFDFPEDEFLIRDNYTPPTVYHGWIKKTMFKTSKTTPIPGHVTEQTFRDIIDAEMTGQFDEANDKLDFRDRRTTQYKIIGKQRVFPQRNKSISLPGNVTSVVETGNASHTDFYFGSLPPVFVSCKWEVNRKIGLQMTNSWLGGTPGTDEKRFYPADTYIPFILVFNPSFAKQREDNEHDPSHNRGQITCSFNSVHYYTDS